MPLAERQQAEDAAGRKQPGEQQDLLPVNALEQRQGPIREVATRPPRTRTADALEREADHDGAGLLHLLSMLPPLACDNSVTIPRRLGNRASTRLRRSSVSIPREPTSRTRANTGRFPGRSGAIWGQEEGLHRLSELLRKAHRRATHG